MIAPSIRTALAVIALAFHASRATAQATYTTTQAGTPVAHESIHVSGDTTTTRVSFEGKPFVLVARMVRSNGRPVDYDARVDVGAGVPSPNSVHIAFGDSTAVATVVRGGTTREVVATFDAARPLVFFENLMFATMAPSLLSAAKEHGDGTLQVLIGQSMQVQSWRYRHEPSGTLVVTSADGLEMIWKTAGERVLEFRVPAQNVLELPSDR